MPAPGRYDGLAARALRTFIAQPTATTTTLKALATDHPSRVDGSITVVLADSSVWVFDLDSAAGAQDGILVPDSGDGRWKLLGVPGSGGAGVDYKGSVRVATTGALAAYTRTANVILADANGAIGAIDGVTLAAGERFLLKDGAAGADNGIWRLDVVGTAGSKYQATRAEDFDTSADVTAGALVYVSEGTLNGNAWYMLTTNDSITLNTTALTFTKLPTLADLASTSAGLGASLVGVEDADAVITGATAEAALVELAKRSLGTFANEAAIKAIAAAKRTNGAIAVDATNDVIWVFDTGSAAGASAWVLVPDAGTGRWLRNHPSLADLAAITTGNGAALIGIEDAGTLYAAANVEAALAEVKAIADAANGFVKRTVTVGHADLTELVNGTAQAINIGAACPANARVVTVSIYGTELTGGGVVSVALDVGTAGDPNAIIAAADVLSAFVDGEALTRPLGIAPNKKIGAAQLIATFTPDGGHALADLAAGSVTIDVLVSAVA